MPTLKNALSAVSEFQERFRHPSLAKFSVSGLYDLFPGEPLVGEVGVPSSAWPEKWPHSDEKGVYLIVDHALNVLYVGKASFSSSMGYRLSSHFPGSKVPRAKPSDSEWQGQPRFVLTIAMPEASPFEASSLEEYLIRQLDPIANVVGRKAAKLWLDARGNGGSGDHDACR